MTSAQLTEVVQHLNPLVVVLQADVKAIQSNLERSDGIGARDRLAVVETRVNDIVVLRDDGGRRPGR